MLDSLAAVISFFFFVAPGLTYELIRERRRPQVEESSFREATRIALASVLLSTLSVAVIALVRARRPELMPDPGAWLAKGNGYLIDEYRLIARTAGLLLLLSTLTALVAAFLAPWVITRRQIAFTWIRQKLKRKRPPTIVPSDSGWDAVFSTRAPSNAYPMVKIILKDSPVIWHGRLLGATPGATRPPREREIVLTEPLYREVPPDDPKAETGWHSVVLAGDQIQQFFVRYVREASHSSGQG